MYSQIVATGCERHTVVFRVKPGGTYRSRDISPFTGHLTHAILLCWYICTVFLKPRDYGSYYISTINTLSSWKNL